MTESVAVPLWLAIVVAALAAWTVVGSLLLPAARTLLRRRHGRLLDEFNARLAIRIQPFKLTKRQVLIDRLIFDARVQEAAEEMARDRGMPRQAVHEKVERYAREIVPAFNAYVYFRFGYWLARRVASALYRVRLGQSDEAGLRAVPAGATVVFVMNHRSNMDYVLVSYLAAERTALSYAVGEWARIWPLESLIRSMGAYFVRRRSRNELYRRVLQRYVQMATAEGVTQAVFPEGQLSRDGRLLPPKLGLLDYMLRDFDPQGGRDLVFVPVGINYDRVLEDRTLLLDLEPGAERKGTLASLGTLGAFVARNVSLMARGRWFRFGYACVNFGTPVAVRAYLAERGLDLRRLGAEQRFARVGELAAYLMSAVGRVVPVLPVSLVASVLLAEPERSWSELELKSAVQRLGDELEAAGAGLYIPRRDREYAIQVGLRMLRLRRVVVEEDGLLRPRAAELPLLAYYANSIAHLRPVSATGPPDQTPSAPAAASKSSGRT